MPGHMITGKCSCGFERELNPGSALRDAQVVDFSIAYTADETDLRTERCDVISLHHLRVIRDPFLQDHDGTFDLQKLKEHRRKQESPQGPYLCPQCRAISLYLYLHGFWD
jgi:hypothetical protein